MSAIFLGNQLDTYSQMRQWPWNSLQVTIRSCLLQQSKKGLVCWAFLRLCLRLTQKGIIGVKSKNKRKLETVDEDDGPIVAISMTDEKPHATTSHTDDHGLLLIHNYSTAMHD